MVFVSTPDGPLKLLICSVSESDFMNICFTLFTENIFYGETLRPDFSFFKFKGEVLRLESLGPSKEN